MGLCLPKECTQSQFDSFAKMQVDGANWFFSQLPNYGIVLDGSLFRTWTRVSLTMTKSDEYQRQWVERTSSGFYPTITIIGLIILVALASTIVVYYNAKCKRKHLLESNNDI